MNFDAVKTRLHRVRRAAPESFDDAGDFLQRQGPRLADIGEYAADEGLAFGGDRRRSNGSAIIRLQGSVRNAPDVPDLNEDASAARVHALRHLAPAGHLLLGKDTGRVLVTLALLRDLARLGDQQTGGGALAVILHRQRARHHAGDRAIARQRRHHQPIWKGDRAKLVGLEEFGRGVHFFSHPGFQNQGR